MSEPQNFEVRTDDNRLFCMARLIEGDILLILKPSARLKAAFCMLIKTFCE